ncbi:MAG: MMPL family transporter [Gammaproteobacteria bacterium]|nr:MMPL family transporter [Gammaproteobacteria bacterium]
MTATTSPLDRYVSWLQHNRVPVIVITLVVSLVLSAGAHRLTTSNDLRAYFSADNPQLAALEAMENTYERQDNLIFMVVAKDGDLFTEKGLRLIAELTRQGWQAPYSRRVTSLTNHQHTFAKEDDLFVIDLVDDAVLGAPERIAAVRDIALSEPVLKGRTVSADGRASGVNIGLTLPEGGAAEANAEVVEWAEGMVATLRQHYPNFDIWIGGTTATDVALGLAVQRDVQTLVGTSYLVIVAGLFLFLRHLAGTLATVGLVTLSIAVTMGSFGWAGATLEPTAGFVPSIVMTIAVADSVHILATYYYELRHGRDKSGALSEAMRVNVAPIFITSVTTAIGVLMLNLSDSPPYRELGNMIAFGVAVAWALSMTLLPAILALAPVRHVDRGSALESGMSRYAEWLLAHRHAVLAVTGLVIITLASCIPRNQLGERWHEYFDDTFEAKKATDVSIDHFGGIHVVLYDVRARSADGINDPAYLRDLEKFSNWLEAQPPISYVNRVTTLLKRLNKNLHGDDPDWHRLPDSRELSAQLLLLYELSLPLGMGLENTINVERSGSQVQIIAEPMNSEALRRLDLRIQQWLKQNTTALQPTAGTGIDLVFAYINHRNIYGMLQGMVLALVLISLLLIGVLRSLRLGALSMLTNLAPAALAYGTWALLSGNIDLSASVVMCMSIGIVVDDTVHFLSKYRHARVGRGHGAADALRYAFNTVGGAALTVTTAVLVAGFCVLAASHFDPTVTTGTLMAITLTFALVVDFLFLPPLLLLVDTKRSTPAPSPPQPSST